MSTVAPAWRQRSRSVRQGVRDRGQRAGARGHDHLGLLLDAFGDERRRLLCRRRPLRQLPAVPGRLVPDLDRHPGHAADRDLRLGGVDVDQGTQPAGPDVGSAVRVPRVELPRVRLQGPGIVWGWMVCGVMFWLMAAPAAFGILVGLKKAMVPPSQHGPTPARAGGCRRTPRWRDRVPRRRLVLQRAELSRWLIRSDARCRCRPRPGR